jgi:monothiol glutaredoxin
MTRDVMQEIKEEVARNPVVLYLKGTSTAPECGFSAVTASVLREIGVDFKEVNVLADQEKREAIKVFSDWPTIPQLYVGGAFVGGCEIVQEMHDNGDLEQLVRDALGEARLEPPVP